jgi:hypothetical protein
MEKIPLEDRSMGTRFLAKRGLPAEKTLSNLGT